MIQVFSPFDLKISNFRKWGDGVRMVSVIRPEEHF